MRDVEPQYLGLCLIQLSLPGLLRGFGPRNPEHLDATNTNICRPKTALAGSLNNLSSTRAAIFKRAPIKWND